MTDALRAALAGPAERYDGDPAEAAALVEAALDRAAWRRRRGVRECQRCHRDLPPSKFGRDSRSTDGLRPRCRVCESAVNARRRSL